jgi:hypothetical protein
MMSSIGIVLLQSFASINITYIRQIEGDLTINYDYYVFLCLLTR